MCYEVVDFVFVSAKIEGCAAAPLLTTGRERNAQFIEYAYKGTGYLGFPVG